MPLKNSIKAFKTYLGVRISSVVYSIWENTVDEHT